MPEILFIAIDPCILALVDNLQPLVEPEISVLTDYSSGIKRIFDARPAVVFLQHKIGNLGCDKLANQVRMLLGEGAVPLVLLTDEPAVSMSYSVASTFLASFDLCLPLDELSSQVQTLLRTLPDIPWKEKAAAVEPQPADLPFSAALEAALPPATLEITVPAGASEFFLPFPWKDQTDGASDEMFVAPLAALEGNAVSAAERSPDPGPESPFLTEFLQDRFVIDPLTLPAEQPGQPGQPDRLSQPCKPRRTDLPAAGVPAYRESSLTDYHRIEKATPDLLFGSMSDPQAPAASSGKPAAGRPAVREPRAAKEAPTAKVTGPGETGNSAGRSKKAASPPPTLNPLLKTAETQHPAEEELTDAAAAVLGIRKKESRYFRTIVIVSLLIVSAGALDLIYQLHYAGRAGRSPNPRYVAGDLLTPPAAPGRSQLPQFIPQVPPDPGYAAGHPGWERYQDDALEYLVFREKGSIRAVQVLSQAHGAISAPFLKTCIRICSGHEQFVIKKTDRRDGVEVSSGSLQNGGELVIYRDGSGGDIRGFVLTYPG